MAVATKKNVKIPKMAKISIDELKQKVKKAKEQFYKDNTWTQPSDEDKNGYFSHWDEVFSFDSDISSDIRCIEEKDYIEDRFIPSEQWKLSSDPMNEIVGYNTLSNGASFLGIHEKAENEDTASFYFLIYWDGKKLQSYIPTKGNGCGTDPFESYYNYTTDLVEKLKKLYPIECKDLKDTNNLKDVDFRLLPPLNAESLKEDIAKHFKFGKKIKFTTTETPKIKSEKIVVAESPLLSSGKEFPSDLIGACQVVIDLYQKAQHGNDIWEKMEEVAFDNLKKAIKKEEENHA